MGEGSDAVRRAARLFPFELIIFLDRETLWQSWGVSTRRVGLPRLDCYGEGGAAEPGRMLSTFLLFNAPRFCSFNLK
jgi:hypothetical protein